MFSAQYQAAAFDRSCPMPVEFRPMRRPASNRRGDRSICPKARRDAGREARTGQTSHYPLALDLERQAGPSPFSWRISAGSLSTFERPKSAHPFPRFAGRASFGRFAAFIPGFLRRGPFADGIPTDAAAFPPGGKNVVMLVEQPKQSGSHSAQQHVVGNGGMQASSFFLGHREDMSRSGANGTRPLHLR